MAKHSLIRPLGRPSEEKALALMEAELLEKINLLGIGPQGLGGKTTALAVHIESFPTPVSYTHLDVYKRQIRISLWTI